MKEKENNKKKNSQKHKRLAKGVRKFIRNEKARLRKEISDTKERHELINKLREGFISKS